MQYLLIFLYIFQCYFRSVNNQSADFFSPPGNSLSAILLEKSFSDLAAGFIEAFGNLPTKISLAKAAPAVLRLDRAGLSLEGQLIDRPQLAGRQ